MGAGMTDRPEPYHRFVFHGGRFCGDFAGLYEHEETEGFDAWHQQDTRSLSRAVSLAILGRYTFLRILDLGCGKGIFTHALKTRTNAVVGVDIAPGAIAKARRWFPDLAWRCLDLHTALQTGEEWDLVVFREVLSYLPDWQVVVRAAAGVAAHLYVSLWLPPDPVGFVPSLDALRVALEAVGVVEEEALLNRTQLCLLIRVER